MYLDCLTTQIIPPYIPNYQCEVNTGKLLNCLYSGAYNLKAIKSSCNLKTDLNRAKVGHSSDMIFVTLAKLFYKHTKTIDCPEPLSVYVKLRLEIYKIFVVLQAFQ